MSRTFDLIIIGGGPAGIAAGIHATRLGLSTLLFESKELGGQVHAANLIENFAGTPPQPGTEFIKPWIDHLRKTNATIRIENVKNIQCSDDHFIISTKVCMHISKTIIIATGAIPKRLLLHNSRELENLNLFYYPNPQNIYHDGKNIIVIGSGDSAFDQALHFAKKAESTSIFMRGTPKALPLLIDRASNQGVTIYTDQSLRKVSKFENGIRCDFDSMEATADYLIACIGKEAQNPFFKSKNLPNGVFLAGDCTRSAAERHIAIAMGDGMRAATQANQHVKNYGNFKQTR